MIVEQTILILMNDNEPCVELNEIIYRISGEFWKGAYQELSRKQTECEPNLEISASQAISEFRKETKKIANENGLKCAAFSHNDHFYISLTPYPIYIGIEKDTGDFSISAPHISTKQFKKAEYKGGLKWIRDYLAIDVKPLSRKTELVRQKFYLNTKSAQIVKTSINSLCVSALGKKELQYKLNQDRLTSEIIFKAQDNKVYQIELYHKPFTKDTSLLIDLLNKPRELKVEDVISCCRSEEELLNSEEAV